mgnify:FL=1
MDALKRVGFMFPELKTLLKVSAGGYVGLTLLALAIEPKAGVNYFEWTHIGARVWSQWFLMLYAVMTASMVITATILWHPLTQWVPFASMRPRPMILAGSIGVYLCMLMIQLGLVHMSSALVGTYYHQPYHDVWSFVGIMTWLHLWSMLLFLTWPSAKAIASIHMAQFLIMWLTPADAFYLGWWPIFDWTRQEGVYPSYLQGCILGLWTLVWGIAILRHKALD